MSKQIFFRRIVSLLILCALAISFFPMTTYAQETTSKMSFSIDGISYYVDMRFEGDLLYCRADQWAETAGCLFTFNPDVDRALFHNNDPVIFANYGQQDYIKSGDTLWVPFFDAARQTGVYFSKVSDNKIYGYRVTPLAVFYKDMDRMFAVSKYRISELIIQSDALWMGIDTLSRFYAALSAGLISGFLDSVSGKMEQDLYDEVFISLLRTDENLLNTFLEDEEDISNPFKINNLLLKSLEDGSFKALLKQWDVSQEDIQVIVDDLSDDATLNGLSGAYELGEKLHIMDILKLMDKMTVSIEADAQTVMAMQAVFGSSESKHIRQAVQKSIGARAGGASGKVLSSGMYTLEFMEEAFLDIAIEKLEDNFDETIGFSNLDKLAIAAAIWGTDKIFSISDTSEAIMYSDVYSQIQLELVNYYYKHRNDAASDNGLLMHSVALLYLRSCLASWQLFEYDSSLSQAIGNAKSTIKAEITNLMEYTEEELLQNGTNEETIQAITALVASGIFNISEQEIDFEAFLQGYPEYNYYAVLDINQDGTPELLATEAVDSSGGTFFVDVDMFVYRDREIQLAYEDLWSKDSLRYSSDNQWITGFRSGSGGGGWVFYHLDQNLNVHEQSFESYLEYDENGNEISVDYLNGRTVVTEEDRKAFEQLAARHQFEETCEIIFQPVPNHKSSSVPMNCQLKQMSIIYGNGNQSNVYFHYDTSGLLERVSTSGCNAVDDYHYEYDSQNRLVKVERGNIDEDYLSYRCFEFYYDENGIISEWYRSYNCEECFGKALFGNDGQQIGTEEYFEPYAYELAEFTYNSQGQLVAVNEMIECEGVTTKFVQYDYDSQNRISNTYDENGNLTSTYCYDYAPLTMVTSGKRATVYCDFGFLKELNVHTARDVRSYFDDPFRFTFYSLDNMTVDANGCVTSMEGTTRGGQESVELEFIYSNSDNVQTSSIYSDYLTILQNYPDIAEYTLYDIDKDGYDELIVREYAYHFIYSYNGDTVQRCTDSSGCGEYNWNYWPDCLYKYDGNGLIVHDGGFGENHYEYVFLYSLREGLLEITDLLDSTEIAPPEYLYADLEQWTPINHFLQVTNDSLLKN